MDSPTETGIEISNDSNSFEEISSDQDRSSPVTPESERIKFENGSFDVSPNHDSSDSSYSELDSEAEAFYSSLNHHLISPRETDSSHEFAERQMSHGELMKRFLKCEEELRVTSLKLRDSEQEIEKLKGESDAEIKAAQREIEAKDSEIATEKRRVLDLETKLSDSAVETENLHRDIAGLLEKKTFLEARVKETESYVEVLEDQVKHYDAEKMEMQHKEVEINALKTNLASRDKHIESLNKEFDNYKLRFDMLMAEKDGVCAEVDNLKAEMRSKDIETEQKEEQLNELVNESRNAKNIAEELRAMVKELKKLGELQRNVILEGEEEKREAIRQLCYSLDHYKSGYRELLKLLQRRNNGQQQHATMAV